jgi:hypothetical protein
MRDAEFESLPCLRVAPLLVLHMQRDGVAVDVLHCGDGNIGRHGSDAEFHGQRHRQHKMRGVELGADQLVANDRPPGRARQINVEAFLLIFAHGVREQQRDRAGDRDVADVDLLLFKRHSVLCDRLGRGQREHIGNRRKRD